MFILESCRGIQVGDKVTIVGNPDRGFRNNIIKDVIGKTGVVKAIIAGAHNPYLIEFEKEIQFSLLSVGILFYSRNPYWSLAMERNCNPSCTNTYNFDELKLVREVKRASEDNECKVQTMKVITQGRKVIVVMHNKNGVGSKRGVASCHVDDEFDFYTGLQIAMARAMGKPLPLISGSEIDNVTLQDKVYADKVRSEITIHSGNNKYNFPVVGEPDEER